MDGFDEGELEKLQNIVIEEVLKAEEEKLHMERPHGIIDDIENIIRNQIKD